MPCPRCGGKSRARRNSYCVQCAEEIAANKAKRRASQKRKMRARERPKKALKPSARRIPQARLLRRQLAVLRRLEECRRRPLWYRRVPCEHCERCTTQHAIECPGCGDTGTQCVECGELRWVPPRPAGGYYVECERCAVWAGSLKEICW